MSDETAKTPSAATASTQQPTQSTEDGSQTSDVTDEDLWGSLVPCSPILPRYKLHKSKLGYRIGRDPENDIVISSRFISWVEERLLISIRFADILPTGSFQCTIEWDGDTGPKSSVIVTDHSRHGTFVNGDRIGKAVILRDGHVIGLGTHKPRPKEGGIYDYRYIYRHLAYKPPKGGVHKVYDMQHELGKGSYATVVKALHKQEGKWYAIKIISTHKLRGHWTDDAALEGLPQTKDARRLLREITVLERLQHKNICQLKEVFVHSRNVYLVLELVPGGDLLRYLMQLDDRGRRMTEQEAKRITYQICDALAYVHRQGIAHRDLKPENVLLTNDKPPVVKVADFGLAKVIDTLTKLHTVCGTPIYLAPEVVLRGWSDGYDQIVDSWSVGIITMIMLTMDTQPVSSVDPHADLKAQIEKRRVNWELLRLNRVSPEGQILCLAF
ncbi:hypothetical protein BN946_scf184894.g11 [Trametes cinnabarina]|uniref:Protein kinase domain-containing protein n=1 Tax=Pycnoporus cinnabarinus TaxID=5643 RepID=A0A060SNV2_PYCCI|nr:hypothetical protein BN946_scf184894.g11 [Trametes cinnabarina]